MNTSRLPVLSVEGLAVQYSTRVPGRRKKVLAKAVDNIDLHIEAGETLALVGESGSGKTSIARAIMRLVDTSSGRILFNGSDLVPLRGAALRKARPGFQMIFQDPFESLDPRRTVLDTVLESLIVSKIGKTSDERRRLALEALERVGLTPAERIGQRFTNQLSGGQRQRVALASAMVLQPSLLIADEPVSMLDVSLRAGILRLMLDLRNRFGIAYLFITHDLSLAWSFADRIVVVYLGRVVEEGPSAELIAAPRHPYTQALVSVIPVPETGATANRTVLTGEIPNPTNIPTGCRFHPRCPLYREMGEPSQCRTEDPQLEATGTHRTACHFHGQETGK
jgi:oligopeptide/dipeptide ABC transporter ATP-binding protein